MITLIPGQPCFLALKDTLSFLPRNTHYALYKTNWITYVAGGRYLSFLDIFDLFVIFSGISYTPFIW